MTKLSYYSPPYEKGLAGYEGLYAFLTYWKAPITDPSRDWDPGLSIEDLDGMALESAKERFKMVEPRIIKRFETKEDCTDGEVRYLIIEASTL